MHHRTRRAILIWLLGSLLVVSAAADVIEEWVELYDNIGGHDTGRAVTVDSGGHVIVTGQSLGFLPGFDYTYEYATLKLDGNGELVWVARYNGPGLSFNDEPVGVAVDADDNVYVSGSSPGPTTDLDVATVKYDPDGIELWARRWNGPADRTDGAAAMAVGADGTVHVVGGSYSPGTVTDMITLTYDREGTLAWSATYHGGYGTDSAGDVALGPAGSVYVTGQSIRSSGFYDWVTIKYDVAGNQEWVAFVDGSLHSHDHAHALAVDTDGNAYVTGYTVGAGSTYVLTTVSYDADGTERWSSFSHAGEVGSTIALDASGNTVVGCWSGLVVSYDPNGVERWAYDFGGGGNARPQASAVDAAGNWYLTGYRFLGDQDILTVGLDPDGQEVWSATYEGPGGDDSATAIALTGGGDVIVAGASDLGVPRNLDICTIRYDAATVAVPPAGGASGERIALRVSPSPVRDVARLTFHALPTGAGTLSVFDATGRRVDRFAVTGGEPILWDVPHGASGVYWATLDAGGARSRVGMVVVR